MFSSILCILARSFSFSPSIPVLWQILYSLFFFSPFPCPSPASSFYFVFPSSFFLVPSADPFFSLPILFVQFLPFLRFPPTWISISFPFLLPFLALADALHVLHLFFLLLPLAKVPISAYWNTSKVFVTKRGGPTYAPGVLSATHMKEVLQSESPWNKPASRLTQRFRKKWVPNLKPYFFKRSSAILPLPPPKGGGRGKMAELRKETGDTLLILRNVLACKHPRLRPPSLCKVCYWTYSGLSCFSLRKYDRCGMQAAAPKAEKSKANRWTVWGGAPEMHILRGHIVNVLKSNGIWKRRGQQVSIETGRQRFSRCQASGALEASEQVLKDLEAQLQSSGKDSA